MDMFDPLLQSATAHRLQRARIRAVPAQHSWAALPGPLVNKLLNDQVETPVVLKLTPIPGAGAPRQASSPFSNSSSSAASTYQPRYVAWAGATASSPGCIELSAQLAAALQLPTGTEVQLEVLPHLAAAAAVVVEPVGAADWEVVELNAGLLEAAVLGQAGVVALGQPFVVWARQAKVTFRVTQIIHDAAAAAGGRSGRYQVLSNVARLDQGSEMHIAPKPRVTAAGPGGSLAPGKVALGPPAAAAAGDSSTQQQHAGSTAAQQQQQMKAKPVWLRVTDASSQQLLSGQNFPETSLLFARGNGSLSSNGSSSVGSSDKAASQEPPAAASGPPVASWLTTAVHVSSQTATDLYLQPGGIMRLYGSSSSSTGQSVLPLQSVVVVLLIDNTVPWGHVAVSPPLQQGLGLSLHQFAKLRPLQRQQQLQQLPGFLLHPLLPAQHSASTVAATAALAATPAGASASADTSAGAAALRMTPATAGAAAAASTQQQQQQQAFTGPGLVLDTVKGFVTMPLQILKFQSSIQQGSQQPTIQQQQQPRQQQQQNFAVEHNSSSPAVAAGSSNGAASLPEVLLQPGVANAAVAAWWQLQAAGVVASAACSAANADLNGSAANAGGSEAVLPVCGPILMHFKVNNQQQQQQQQDGGSKQQQQDGASQQPAGAGSCTDYLLLLVSVGGQQGSGSTPVSYMPAHLLLRDSIPSKQRQEAKQHLSVQLAGVLTFEPAAVQSQVSAVAQQQAQYITCIQAPSMGALPLQHPPLAQASAARQGKQPLPSKPLWLDPAEYPWLNPALQTCLERLKPRLDLLTWQSWQSVDLPLPGGVLLVGGSEGGRSWLLQLLGQEAAVRQGAHVLKVSCKSLSGQSYEAAAAVLAAAAAEALSCCPGLLLLDDLELLTPAPNTEGPAGLEQDQTTATRLAELLSGLMHWAAKQPRPLSFCAAVSAAAALPAALRAAGCLDCEVKIPPLGLQGRAALMLAGFKAKGLGFSGGLEGLEALAGKGLEGYDGKDLQLVVDRAVHAALSRQMTPATAVPVAATNGSSSAASPVGVGGGKGKQEEQALLVTAEDVQQALTGFVAAAFWRAGQHKGQQQGTEGGLQGWQDVGGLHEAVAALKEALVLPAKYSHLLAAAPLRLRTGLLLFGPPGCGKTHVVAAAVAATGARLISVKGPELLNKYIGQSEAAVRELFSRAAAAAPCVLFFDEFDAIAPPRGHDSTGVTDRVVNQLLTELDGVEGLTGVAVLAATSRPDLIDAALLRPGRLDRTVYCGFPRETDRLAILQAVARKLALAEDVSLADIARSTQGFTGADLAAILSEAQLLAVHDQIDSAPLPQPDTSAPAPAAEAAAGVACVLSGQHLQRALSRARPSLPAAEKQRFEAVYARFQQARDPGLSNRPAVPEEEQLRVKHATLA